VNELIMIKFVLDGSCGGGLDEQEHENRRNAARWQRDCPRDQNPIDHRPVER